MFAKYVIFLFFTTGPLSLSKSCFFFLLVPADGLSHAVTARLWPSDHQHHHSVITIHIINIANILRIIMMNNKWPPIIIITTNVLTLIWKVKKFSNIASKVFELLWLSGFPTGCNNIQYHHPHLPFTIISGTSWLLLL